jgi:hypothetical protein
MDELVVSSWMEFMLHLPKWGVGRMFRGVTDASYELIPKIGRADARQHGGYEKQIEAAMFDRFKSMAVQYVTVQPTNDLDWLVLAQHHGVPTRLLDWTTNPLVALYFAVENSVRETARKTDAAVYVMRQHDHVVHHGFDPLEVNDVLLVVPKTISPRVFAQSALLTLHPEPATAYVPSDLLKVIIRQEAQENIHFMLHYCGVHRASLFPGLDGLSDELTYWLRKGITMNSIPPGS